MEQWSLTGGKQSSFAISVFRTRPASSKVIPRTSTKRLELDVGDGIVGRIDSNLKLHDISASWCANETSSHIGISLWHASNISWARVMVENLLMILSSACSSDGRCDLRS